MRVVTLRNGETIHNAFLDRSFLNFMRFRRMKLHYAADTDSLYIELRDSTSVASEEVAPCGLGPDAVTFVP